MGKAKEDEVDVAMNIYIVVANSYERDDTYNIGVFVNDEGKAIAFAKQKAPDYYHVEVEHWKDGVEQQDVWATYWPKSEKEKAESRNEH